MKMNIFYLNEDQEGREGDRDCRRIKTGNPRRNIVINTFVK